MPTILIEIKHGIVRMTDFGNSKPDQTNQLKYALLPSFPIRVTIFNTSCIFRTIL